MRKFIVIGTMVITAVAATFAADNPVTIAPTSQPATDASSRIKRAVDVCRELSTKTGLALSDDSKSFPERIRLKCMPYELETWTITEAHDANHASSCAFLSFLLNDYISEYLEVRPWLKNYDTSRFDYYRRAGKVDPSPFTLWPELSDIPSLRQMLGDSDPAIRGMATEAIATLGQPEDLPSIAMLLDDGNIASPIFYGERDKQKLPTSAIEVPPLRYSWHRDTVSRVAQRAIKLMTDHEFSTSAEFDKWWKINGDWKNCLWYWQKRLELATLVARNEFEILQKIARIPASQLESHRDAIIRRHFQAEAKEIAKLSPEVEAKIYLLVSPSYFDPPKLRLTSDRLIELIDGKGLWADVEWHDGLRQQMVGRIEDWATSLFTAADIPKLKLLRNCESNTISRTSLDITISRLLPSAGKDNLDDTNTRDGMLRELIRKSQDANSIIYYLYELSNVAAAENTAFLVDQTITDLTSDEHVQIIVTFYSNLSYRPYNTTKRIFLANLLANSKFQSTFSSLSKTYKNTEGNASRGTAARILGAISLAVNAYAGKTIIDEKLLGDLSDPAKSADAFAKLHLLAGQLKDSPLPQSNPAPTSQPTSSSTSAPAIIPAKATLASGHR